MGLLALNKILKHPYLPIFTDVKNIMEESMYQIASTVYLSSRDPFYTLLQAISRISRLIAEIFYDLHGLNPRPLKIEAILSGRLTAKNISYVEFSNVNHH